MKKKKIGILALTLTTIFSCTTINVNAATTYTEALPPTVERKDIKEEYVFNKSGINLSESTSNVVEFLSSDSNYLLYCTDKNNTHTDKATLTKGSKMDYRIAYILTHGHGSSNPDIISGILEKDHMKQEIQSNTNGKGQDMANLWITQVAIWNLQNTISKNDLNNSDILSYHLGSDESNTFDLYTSQTTGLGSTTLWNNVEQLVGEANTKEDPETATLSITGDTNWTKSDNISKTGLLTIEPSNDLVTANTYTITSIDNAPDGLEIHKEDGTLISPGDSIEAGTKIYLTIDNTKINDTEEYNFALNAKATGTYNAAYQYVDTSNQCNSQTCQPSVLVGPEQKDINGTLNLKIIPNTASNLSKTIYYIGFIILLIGAGTIYANVRPKKQETE